MSFNITKNKGNWDLWEHIDGSRRRLGEIDPDDVMGMFNNLIGEDNADVLMEGDPNCYHAYRPWKFDRKYIKCNNCDRVMIIKKAIPRIK
jgi:hypothetical protein